MKKDRLFILLIFMISFLLPLSCAFSCYDVIVEADFLRNGVKYEAVDIENLFLDKQNLTGVIPFPCCLFFEDKFFELLLGFSIPTPLIHPTSSVLRC
jgi:hypothetical protein